MTQTITANNIEAFVAEEPLVILDFWADWCMPCKIMTPMIQELHAASNNAFKLGIVDDEDQPELAERNDI